MDLTTTTRNSSSDGRLERVVEQIKAYPDFPKSGVVFRDIFPVFYKPQVLCDLVSLLEERVKNDDVDAVVGVEARGFLIAPLIALTIRKPFIPIRKAGKLPGETHKITYNLEYGTDCLEIQKGSVKGLKCVVIDDLLATGGTLRASCQLLELSGANVCECLVVMELEDLKGRQNLKWPVYSLIQL